MTPHEYAGPAGWAWVDHLRHGGSVSWRDWAGSSAESSTGSEPVMSSGGRLPGAAQLELIRRLARHAEEQPGLDVRGRAFTALADRVLDRSGPGRGLAELPLAWPGDHGAPSSQPRSLLGPRPVDPADVPIRELLRVAAGVLAELVLQARPIVGGRVRTRRRRPWSRSFVVTGAPVTAARLRDGFAAAGHVEGGRRPIVLVVAAPFEDALQQVWTARVRDRSEARWPTFVAKCAKRDSLPRSMDLPLLAERWAQRVGAERVHVVAPTQDDPGVRRTSAELLGLPEPPVVPARPPSSAAEVDLVRRLNTVLKVRVDRVRHRTLLETVVPALFDADERRSHPPLTVPVAYADWAADRSQEVADRLRAGGYAVHGDANRLVSGGGDSVDRPRPTAVLDVALTACLRAAARAELETGEVRR